MRKKRLGLFALILSGGLFILCLGCSFAIYQLVFLGYLGWECAPPRSFKLTDLALPADLFPPHARMGTFVPLTDSEAGELRSRHMDVYWDGGGGGSALYRVLLYGGKKRAGQNFSVFTALFSNRQTGLWSTPPELSDVSSPSADQFYIGCGNDMNGRMCGMVAQYEEFLITFGAYIDNKMTYKNFAQVVEHIDQHMDKRLHPLKS